MRVGKLSRGFTIVELLIVIVVIGILAALVLNSFANAQAKARDAKRQSDVNSLVKGLEVYYASNGRYPNSYNNSTSINSGWSTTADASWLNFVSTLKPYMGDVPSDPISTLNTNVQNSGFNYAYFSDAGSTYCGTSNNQMYILLYRLEVVSQTNNLIGNCTATILGPYGNGVNNYRKTQI